jgi:hypothetical protein
LKGCTKETKLSKANIRSNLLNAIYVSEKASHEKNGERGWEIGWDSEKGRCSNSVRKWERGRLNWKEDSKGRDGLREIEK